MRRIQAFLAAVVVVAATLAGCRLIDPADGSEQPAPGGSQLPWASSSEAPRLSPSLEVPPPVY